MARRSQSLPWLTFKRRHVNSCICSSLTSALDLLAPVESMVAAGARLRVQTLPLIDNAATVEPSSHCKENACLQGKRQRYGRAGGGGEMNKKAAYNATEVSRHSKACSTRIKRCFEPRRQATLRDTTVKLL